MPRPIQGCAVLVLLAVALAVCAAPPARQRITYELTYNGLTVAEGQDILEHDGRTYRIQSEQRGKGIYGILHRGTVARSSRGEIGTAGLRPLEFRDQRGDRAPELAHFDWGKRIVVHERDSRTTTSPLGEGMQDRVSLLWTFAFAPPKVEFAVQVADGRGTTGFRYAIAGKESLKTPAGDIEALHLVKLRDPGDDRQTEIWLDARRSYVPVRLLVIEKDGTRMDQVVTRFEP